MAYVLVSVELYPSDDERQRREQLANVLERKRVGEGRRGGEGVGNLVGRRRI